MSAAASLDQWLERVAAGERLSADDLRALAATPDILQVGMLADAARRRRHGTRVTYLRLATYPIDAVPSADTSLAKEIRLTGSPASLAAAVAAVEAGRRVAGARTLTAYSWLDIERLAAADGTPAADVARRLKQAGLDGLAELPADKVASLGAAVDALGAAGFTGLKVTIEQALPEDRVGALLAIGAEHERTGLIRALNPLPTRLNALRPSTGYDDVKGVAIARLAAPTIESIQVDWLRYGPKLAQVALTFGADDIDGVAPTDDAPEGRRRAPIEDVRRNVEAAGFTPVERDGRYQALA